MVQKLETPKEILDDLQKKFKDKVKIEGNFATVVPEAIADVCSYLKEKDFDHLSNLSGVDLVQQKQLAVVYHLWSTKNRHIVALKVFVPRDVGNHVCHEGRACEGASKIPSISEVYPIADWHEREVFDLFGIVFDGHPNLKRLLLKDEWVGHPLRKDDTSGVPAYNIDWKLSLMRSDEKYVFNMKSINVKLARMKEAEAPKEAEKK